MTTKQFISVGCLSLLMAATAYAGSISSSMVPAQVKEAFAKQFPQAQVLEWDYEDDENAYEVEAKVQRAEIKALYRENGELIRSKEDVSTHQIPSFVLEEIQKNWPRAEVLGANKITTPKETVWDVGLKFRDRHHNVKIKSRD